VGAAMSNGLRDNFDFIQARNFTPANRVPPSVDLIVIHTMEAPLTPGTARNIATWFASDAAPRASVHYCIDNAEVIQTLPETQVAWGAEGANGKGIHLEHAGYANFSPNDWARPEAQAMLTKSAALVAQIARDWNIPVQYVNAADLARGLRGITTHADVTKFSGIGDHWDPGPHFPMGDYIRAVQGEASFPWHYALGGIALGSAVVYAAKFLVSPKTFRKLLRK